MKVSAFVATSIDGYIARADGSMAWQTGKQPATDYGFTQFYAAVDLLIVGRHTFARSLSANVWPYGTKRMVVMSRNYVDIPATLARYVETTTFTPQVLLQNLAREQISQVFVDGGLTIQSFLRAGLLSDMTLTRIPILLGQGVSLFGGAATAGNQEQRLEHINTQVFDDGVVQSHYAIGPSGQRRAH